MRMPLIAGALLVAAVAVTTAAQQPSAAKSSIEGIVARAANGEPISGARVILARAAPATAASAARTSTTVIARGAGAAPSAPPPAQPPSAVASVPPVTTDSAGRFAFNDLDAGVYALTVFANGFARQNYGQRVPFGPSTLINLPAGQAMKGIVMPMTAAGSVNGHIRDAAGEPLADVPVQLLRATYNAAGQRAFQGVGIARTNDRGEYRVYWVTPGRYYLNAGSPPGPANRAPEVGGAGASPNAVPGESYVLTYFPGVLDAERASIVEVHPGEETSAVDLVTSRQHLYRVRGRIVDSTGAPPPAVSVSLAFRSLTLAGAFSSGTSYEAATGKFELRNVTPGLYVVQATVPDTTPASADAATKAAAAAARPSARAPIEVSHGDVDGVALTLAAAASIPARFIAEGGALSAIPNWERVRIQLRPSLAGVADLPGPNLQPVPPPHLPPAADGTFRIDGVVPGEFIVAPTALPAGVFIKEARFNQTDALNQPMQFSGSIGDLDIVLGTTVGQIDGVVLDEQSKPVPNVLAVLIPDTQRNRPELYKTGLTNADGRFLMRNIAPGNYKIFAWEALESYAYFDPDFVRRMESRGTPVDIAGAARESAQVRVVPAGQ